MESISLNLLRIVVGFVFLQHGGQKLFGAFGGVDGSGGSIALISLLGLAGVLEFVGGLAVMIGLYTRPVAFVLSGQMAVAYFMSHAPQGFWPIMNGGERAVLFCFVFFYLAFKGGGDWSVEEKLLRKI